MSTRNSLAYKYYDDVIVHIYFEQLQEKYYITDEKDGIVELPGELACKFAEIIDKKMAKGWRSYLEKTERIELIEDEN